MKEYVFGVDLGGTTIKFGLFDIHGDLVNKWEAPTRTERSGANILPDISAALAQEMERREIAAEQVLGVGMAVPGAVMQDTWVAPCVNLNQWGGDVGTALRELCGMPVVVCNDANAAAMGETSRIRQGGGDVVFITLGTGVGGGIITGGKLLSGFHGAGGEFGHIKVRSDETQPCGCGKYGCLEQYVAAPGIVRMARERLKRDETNSALRTMPDFSAKDVFDCAKAGDEAALEVVDQATRILGRAIASISCVCDPETVIIGGGVAAAGEIILKGVEDAFHEAAFPASEKTQFRLASLGNDAGIYGCCQLALTELSI